MLRPSGSTVLPFKIKKASLALRIESRLEKQNCPYKTGALKRSSTELLFALIFDNFPENI